MAATTATDPPPTNTPASRPAMASCSTSTALREPRAGCWRWRMSKTSPSSRHRAPPSVASTATSPTRAITGQLLAHCERMRYRVAVLDSPDGAIVGEIRDERARLDSKYGALYYPWVRAFDPISENELAFPPSGYITGIYARNDIERGVHKHKAPANEVIWLAARFETLVNRGQQEVLNPLGVNCLRFFEGRGFRVWGARGITS